MECHSWKFGTIHYNWSYQKFGSMSGIKSLIKSSILMPIMKFKLIAIPLTKCLATIWYKNDCHESLVQIVAKHLNKSLVTCLIWTYLTNSSIRMIVMNVKALQYLYQKFGNILCTCINISYKLIHWDASDEGLVQVVAIHLTKSLVLYLV